MYNDMMLNTILNSVCTHLLNKSSQKKSVNMSLLKTFSPAFS